MVTSMRRSWWRYGGLAASAVLVLTVICIALFTDQLYVKRTSVQGQEESGSHTVELTKEPTSQEFSSNYDYLDGVMLYLVAENHPTGTVRVSLCQKDRVLDSVSIDVSQVQDSSWTEVKISRMIRRDTPYQLEISFVRDSDCPEKATLSCVMNPGDTVVESDQSTLIVTESAGEQGSMLLGFYALDGRTKITMGWVIFMAVLSALLVIDFLFPDSRPAVFLRENRFIQSRHGRKALVILISVLQFLLLVPNVVYHLTNIGLDPSWRYFLNVAGEQGYIFGRDIFFTYGPLGYLCYLMNLNNGQYIAGLVIWGCLFAVHILLLVILCRYVLSGQLSLTAFALSFFCYLPLIHDTQTDNYMLFLVLLGVAVWKIGDRKKKTATVLVNALLCLMFFSKFSTFSNSVVFLLFFIGLELVFERDWHSIFLLLPACVITPVLYLLYNPSVRDLIAYVSGVLKISSGWMKTQQWDDMYSAREFRSLYLIIALYLLLLLLSVLADRHRSTMLAAGSVSLFMAYKYGVGAHGMPMTIWLTAMLFTVFYLTLPVGNPVPAGTSDSHSIRRAGKSLAILICCISITMLQSVNLRVGSTELKQMVLGKIHTATHLSESSLTPELAAEADIPQEMLDLVGDQTISVYPWRTAYQAVYPDLHVIVGPSVQNCNLFIPWLDELEADWYRSDKAPEYLLVHEGTIFNHLKGLENPLTWEAIWQNYETVMTGGGMILLEKKEDQTVVTKTFLCSKTYGITDVIEVPEDADYAVIHVKMALQGKLKDLFYRAGMMTMTVTYADGRSDSGSLVVPNLESGFYTFEYPQTMERTEDLFSGEKMPEMTTFQLSGTAVRCYESTMTIDWYSAEKKQGVSSSL